MDDAHDAEPEQSPYIRLPWGLVAAGLGGVLLLALVLGLFANRYLRPQVGVVPTPTVIPLALATAPGPTDAPVPTLEPTPTLAPAPLVLILATPTAEPSATAAALVAIATPTSLPSPTLSVGSSPTPSARPTVDPVLADEVGKAYEQFWRVQSQALLELDTTHLAEVMDGDYLANVQKRIDSLRAEGRAIKTHVVLNYSVVSATTESASVFDGLEDNSVYVSIGTEEPQTTPTADQLRALYQMKNFSGEWKVVDSVRSE